MDTKQTNRIAMFKTVNTYLDNHNGVWNGMAPLVTAVQAFKAKITAIDAAAQRQETPTGATAGKASARDQLEDVLFLTCEALGALAHASDDHELLALTSLSPSAIDILGAEELVNRATTVLGRANALKAELATVQVTQGNLDEFTQALQNFRAAKEQPRTATAQRMAQTQSLASLIREANEILRKQIDRLVNLFRRSHPDFVTGYEGARVIVDRAATHGATKADGSTPPPTP